MISLSAHRRDNHPTPETRKILHVQRDKQQESHRQSDMTQAQVHSETMLATGQTFRPVAVACLYDLIEMSEFIPVAVTFILMLSHQLLQIEDAFL